MCHHTVRNQEAYAGHIQKNGIFLGIPDFAVLSLHYGVDVFLLSNDHEVEIPNRPHGGLVSFNKMLPSLTKGQWPRRDSGDQPLHKVWLIASCQATYEKASAMDQNHFFPLFSKNQIGDDWDEMVAQVMGRMQKRVKAAEKRVKEFEDESDTEWFESSMLRLEELRRKAACFETIVSMDMLPCDVPADGNCALWSALALQAGYVLKTQLSTQEKVNQLRHDTCPECRRVATMGIAV